MAFVASWLRDICQHSGLLWNILLRSNEGYLVRPPGDRFRCNCSSAETDGRVAGAGHRHASSVAFTVDSDSTRSVATQAGFRGRTLQVRKVMSSIRELSYAHHVVVLKRGASKRVTAKGEIPDTHGNQD